MSFFKLTLTTSDDREINVDLPQFDLCDYGHEVCFPNAEIEENQISLSQIVVDGAELNAFATINYAHGSYKPHMVDYIALQFFNEMPSVDALMSVLSALQEVFDTRGKCF